MAELKLTVGLKSYDIVNELGERQGTIYFNPSDLGLAGRWSEAEQAVSALAQAAPESAEDLVALDKKIKEQIDYAFGSAVSAVLFKHTSSLALCEDGRLMLENVIDAVAPIIQSAQETAAKASAARMERHTAKYAGTGAGLAPGQQ